MTTKTLKKLGLGSNVGTSGGNKADDRNFQGQDIVRCYKCDNKVRFLCLHCETRICKTCVGDHLETKDSPKSHKFAFYGVDDREISSNPNVEGIVDKDENVKEAWSMALLRDLPESQRIIVCNDQSVMLYQKQGGGDWSKNELRRNEGDSFIRCIATSSSRILYSATNCKDVYETDEHFSTEGARPFFTPETDGWTPKGIAFSLVSPGHILIGLYNSKQKKGNVIKVKSNGTLEGYLGNERGEKPYTNPRFLAENKNGDICISDSVTKNVFVFEREGILRFSYAPPESPTYVPRTVATDRQCNILIAYPRNGIHIIDKDGELLRIVEEMTSPTACCVSLKDLLFVCSKDGDMKEITYLS
ncbi:uncharacterized protein LOC134275532 [Saccostrea cucullata]|uniref:uncharacterized protein LOC134275532 n=1 Tax=Saccostrea cuccullata TaxID=36930 RepID=UPI002ED0503A